MADQYAATMAGGAKVASGSLVSVGLRCLQLIRDGGSVFVRNTKDTTVVVEYTVRDRQLLVKATTYGVFCEPPAWADQMTNLINQEIQQ